MKKLLAGLFVMSMFVIACGGDDCKTCTFEGDSSEICDNGDGTVTYTEDDGTTETDSTDFDSAIALLEAFGASCK